MLNAIQTKDTEANDLIIYCLNCIRHSRNAKFLNILLFKIKRAIMDPIKIPNRVIEVPEAGFTASKLMIIPKKISKSNFPPLAWMKTILAFTRAL